LTFRKVQEKRGVSKEVSLGVNIERTKYTACSHQNAEQNCNKQVPNKSSEYVGKLKYFGMMLTRTNFKILRAD
jgi:hypothetical protein